MSAAVHARLADRAVLLVLLAHLLLALWGLQ